MLLENRSAGLAVMKELLNLDTLLPAATLRPELRQLPEFEDTYVWFKEERWEQEQQQRAWGKLSAGSKNT